MKCRTYEQTIAPVDEFAERFTTNLSRRGPIVGRPVGAQRPPRLKVSVIDGSDAAVVPASLDKSGRNRG
jgi:hypothetical protein